MYYREDGSFGARGGVDLEFELAHGKAAGRWTFRGESGEGALGKDRRPEWIVAAGTVRAEGPRGERIEADSVRYDKKTSMLTLGGQPARLRQGDEVEYEGAGFALRILEDAGTFSVESVALVGATDHVLRPKPGADGKQQGRFATWKVRLLGPAEFDGKQLRIPAGAKLQGFDEQGRLAVDGEADDVVVDLAAQGQGFVPTALHARKRVVMAGYKLGKLDATVRAESLDFTMGSRTIVIGGGTLERPGAATPTRFREAEFDLTEHGVDFKYIAELKAEVR
jgi:hypothetical protein